MVLLTVARTGRSPLAIMLACAGIGLGLALLVDQLRGADLSRLATNGHPGWVLAACAATAVSLFAAVRNLSAFAPMALPRLDTFRAQLAVCGLRVMTPSAISTPVICARYLSRFGLGTAESMAVVGAAQTAQLVMTIVIVALIAAVTPQQVSAPNPAAIAIWAAVAIAVAGAVVLAARRLPAVRRAVIATRDGLRGVFTHARRRPLTVVSGLGASALLTLAHVTAFACCVAAVGGHASLLSLTAIYLGAASAGSLIPTPAGVGAVEAAMIARLVATGMDGSAATAAALLTRLITVWALVPPGWLAMRSLRRRGLR